MPKINRTLLVITLGLLLLYSRFVNLFWGLPYPFHPDELKMALAATEVSLKNIYSSFLWAYGGLHINLTHLVLVTKNFILGGGTINADEATVVLRIISAFASILTVYFGALILKTILLPLKSPFIITVGVLFLIFSPALIQFAHFGTTESILMFSYMAVIYYCLKLIEDKKKDLHFKDLLKIALVSGIGIAVKAPAAIFLAVPIIAILIKQNNFKKRVISLFGLSTLSLAFTFIFSPHYFLYFKEFIGPLLHERDLGSAKVIVFYTRQFIGSTPFIFQFSQIFPFAIGIPVTLLAILGFLIAPYKKSFNLLRLAFLIFFIPTSILFTKWTRNLAPIFPLITIFATIAILQLYNIILKILRDLNFLKKYKHILTLFLNLGFSIAILISLIPGIAFLSIYSSPDTRFQASEWIYKNIPENSYILSETNNVIDLPIAPPNYKSKIKDYNVINFDFYGLDESRELQLDLVEHLRNADYIFVPSRRVFLNHGCSHPSTGKFPAVCRYYDGLFNQRLGFKQIAEFSSYPRIPLLRYEQPDEIAEETWTVFDHPVIRIYKKVQL